jgi:hypothetical protein
VYVWGKLRPGPNGVGGDPLIYIFLECLRLYQMFECNLDFSPSSSRESGSYKLIELTPDLATYIENALGDNTDLRSDSSLRTLHRPEIHDRFMALG